MTLDEIYSKLYDYCQRNQPDRLKKFLEGLSDITDVTYDDGLFLRIAMRKETSQTLKVLLEYYEEKLLQGDHNSLEYKVAKHKFLETLQTSIDTVEASKEIQKVVDKYLPKEEGSDIDELEEIELTFDDRDSTSSHSKGEESEGSTLSHDSAASNNEKYAKLTEYSLKMLEAVQEDPSEDVHLGGENGELIDNQLQI